MTERNDNICYPDIDTKRELLWNLMIDEKWMEHNADQMTTEFALGLGLHDFDYVEKHHDSFTDHKIKHELFMLSVRYSTINIIKFLINKFKIDTTYKNYYGNNCALIACAHVTDLEIVKFLINQMTDNMKFPQRLNERNNNKDTILTYACWTNPNLEIIKYLIDEIHMDIMAKDCESNDCLTIACWKNPNLNVIKYLVEEQNIVVQKKCLSKAIHNTNFSVIEYLIEKLNVDAEYIFGDQVFYFTKKRPMKDIICLIQRFGAKNIKVDKLRDIVYSHCNDDHGPKTFKDFCLFVDSLDFVIPSDNIKIKKPNLSNYLDQDLDQDLNQDQDPNSLITDYTAQLDFLFTCNSNKYYGNRNIVFNSIIFFKEIKDVVEFDPEIEFPGSFSKHVMNLYLHLIHSDRFKIQMVRPCDIIEFLKLIDMYPTQHLSIGHIEDELCCYFEAHSHSNELFLDDYAQNICNRYGFRKMYIHIHNAKISKNQNQNKDIKEPE
jgi:hypothetical protein